MNESILLRCRILAPLLFFTLGAAAWAQTPLPGQGIPKPKGKKAEIRVEVPAPTQRPEEPKTPESYVSERIEALASYPAARGRRAVEELVEAGREVAPILVGVVEGFDPKPKVGAAVALARLGATEAFDAIEALLADRRLARLRSEIWEALAKLDRDRAVAAALARVEEADRPLRASAWSFLRRYGAAVAPEQIRPLLSHREASVRRQAFDLIERSGAASVPLCLDLLGDEDTRIAERAFAYLERRVREAPSEIDWLKAVRTAASTEPPNRRSCHALLLLAQAERLLGRPFLPEEEEPMWFERLGSDDPLVRLSAAVALADLARRPDPPDLARARLREEILSALMEPWFQNAWFPDFRLLFRLVRTRVEEIAGIELGDDLTVWRKAWFGGSGDVPRIRRDLPPERMRELADGAVLVYERDAPPEKGGRRTIVLAGLGALETTDPDVAVWLDRALVLPREEWREWVARLADSPVWERPGLLDPRRRAGGRRTLRVLAEGRERRVEVALEGGSEAFAQVEREVRLLARRLAWQRLHLGPRSALPAFVLEARNRFDPDRDPGAAFRAQWTLAQAALPERSASERVDLLFALDAVRRRAGESWDAKTVGALVQAVDDGFVEGPLEALGHLVARAERSPSALEPYVTALGERHGDEGVGALARVLAESGEAVRYLDDPRPQVRLAAVRACGQARVGGEALLRRLDDPQPRVVFAALEALARQPDESVRERVRAWARGEDPILRRAALRALAYDDGPAAFGLLEETLDDDDTASVRAALWAIGARSEGKAPVRLASFAAARGGADPLAVEAVEALAESPAPGALEQLAGLVGGEDRTLAETAACLLVRRLDPRGLDTVFDMAGDPGRALPALEALAIYYCCDPGPEAAEARRRRIEEPGTGPDGWFARALGLAAGGGPPRTVRLLEALEDERWFVRVRSEAELRGRYGVSFGRPSRYEDPADVARRAQRWRRHLDVVAALEEWR